MRRIIVAATLLPIASAIASGQVSIDANSTLDGASLTTPYSVNLSPAGGTAPYAFTLVSGTLPGLALSPAGIISGTPTSAGAFNFTVMVQDSAGASAVKPFTLPVSPAPLGLTVTPLIVPSSMILPGASLPDAVAGQLYAIQYTATGGNGPYTYVLLPTALFGNHLDLDPQSGLFWGTPLTPTVISAKSLSFSVEVIDADHRTVTQNYTAPVETGSPLIVGGCGTLPAATPGAVYPTQQFQGLISGGTVPYSFSAPATLLPLGLSLTADGQLRGAVSPLAGSGGYQFPLTVTDGTGASKSTSCALSVSVPATPTITTSSPLPPGVVGASYSQTFTAFNVPGPAGPVWTATTLPPGLKLSASGTLSGIPTTAGTYTFTVTATGVGLLVSNSFSLTVAAQQLSITTPATLPGAVQNRPYVQTIPASEPTGNLILVSGTLPEGMWLNGQQLIGTPATSGTFTFTLEARFSRRTERHPKLHVSGREHAVQRSVYANRHGFPTARGLRGRHLPAALYRHANRPVAVCLDR